MYREVFDNVTIKMYADEMIKGNKKVVFWGVGFWGTEFGYQQLKQRGIKPSYYCDNNRQLWGKNIIDGIKCEDYELLVKEKEYTVCIVTVAMYHMQEVLWQLQELGIPYVLPYDRLVEYLGIEHEYFDFIYGEKIAVYTCIVGGYDRLIEPWVVPENYDYYLISDNEPSSQSKYKWIDINELLPDESLDNTRKNRYCKINAHKIFKNYRRSVYMDGNMALKTNIDSLFEQLKRIRIGVGVKNNWSSLYAEAMSMTEQRRDDKYKIYNQVKRYWIEGMPIDFGGAVCNLLIREHNNPKCVKLMEDWWAEVKSESKRDQLSFPYVLWKNGYNMNDVFVISDSSDNDIWYFVDEHNTKRWKH